jgi:hypothetical protein
MYFEKNSINVLRMPTYHSVGGTVHTCTKNKIKPKGSVDSVETIIGCYLITRK